MLTRLQVDGFKNLVGVDVRFGPFTCIAGANGVGKSNLFDAIRFLSALAHVPLVEAALLVRDEDGKSGDIRSLFHRVGDVHDQSMQFVAEMVVPPEGLDELGQKAEATNTFLRYTIRLTYRADDSLRALGSLEIQEEKLEHINRSEASAHLLFPHSAATWRKSVLKGRRTSPYISTELDNGQKVVRLHQDGGSSGRPISRPAASLPRTVISATNAAESPTALIAKQEMRAWRLLQLEPSALRQPDKFTASTALEPDGSHLPATLYCLSRAHPGKDGQLTEAETYVRVANRLAELIDDVAKVWIDRDDRRELLTLMVSSKDGTIHPARALSDGTMRFLALAVLELDLRATGVLCLEEPENGIHPERIPKILQLLQDIATDAELEVDGDNPLRQVIINTHSPAVVQQVPEDSLVVAELKDKVQAGQRFKCVSFGCLPGTWRSRNPGEPSHSGPILAKGQLLAYLNPVPHDLAAGSAAQKKRVIDRKDLTPMIPGLAL
ncbi:MAG: AAA family ATPase [Synechococcales cyanobacterium RM1_1_8]|nr:AAA family ATPase [Synechococcales cyanobacterium RM1_1_8]